MPEPGEQVIVFGHNPLHPSVVNGLDALAWDYQEVLEVIDGAGCVLAYIAGHDHSGGYSRDPATGIHHLTVPSALEAPPGTGSRYLVMELFENSARLWGEGGVLMDPGRTAHCRTCGGSGIALHDGKTCFPCGGSGEGPGGTCSGRSRNTQSDSYLYFGSSTGITFAREPCRKGPRCVMS
mmetsp:Transcript_62308/g.202032  ORF Transcript_62308/g.202032 Transcript_62308/m.202032 type:complete len:180 (+) Transcript_62308:1178-1717(+)